MVTALLDRGYDVNVLSRRGGTPDPRATGFTGNMVTGSGLPAALDGVGTVIDVANVLTMNRDKAVRLFTGSTGTIGRLAASAGATHHIVLSIVGCDKVALGYYQGKVAQEEAALAGPVPATVVRATQFHEFAGQNLRRLRIGPLALVPAMRSQPVAASEVGIVIADIAGAPPAGRAPDLGGPRVEWMPDLARAAAARLGPRSRVVSLRLPGAVGRGFRDGSLTLDATGVARGPSFSDWLAAQPTAAGQR